MTSNQIAYAEHKEKARSNRAQEGLKDREVKEKERTGHSQRFANYGKGVRGFTSLVPSISSLINAANDPSWYNKVPAASQGAANISYQTPVGAITTDPVDYTEYGIITNYYAPVLPHRDGDVDSNWYRSFQSLYQDIRKANSGARNYSIANIAQWVLSAQSILTLWMEGYRAYSVIQHYSAVNRYYGRALCEACGFDPNDMELNLSQYRYYLNLTAARIKKSIPIPQVMPWFYRSIWLAANAFADCEDLAHAHITVNVPSVYYEYGDVEIFSTAISRDGLPYTYSRFKALFTQLFDKVIYSEDAGIIAGDILKAFPNESEFNLPEVIVTPNLPLVWNQLTATQLRNGRVVPISTNAGENGIQSFNITEDSTGILIQPLKGLIAIPEVSSIGTVNEINPCADAYLVSHSKDLSPEENLEINMLNCFYEFENNESESAAFVKVTDCCTEIITDRKIGHYERNDETSALTFVMDRIGWVNGLNLLYAFNLIAKTTNFYDCPIRTELYLVSGTSLTDFMALGTVGSRGYVGFMPKHVYQNFASVATASLLGLTQ